MWVRGLPIKVVVDERGRITIPSEVRRKLRLKKGAELVVEVEGTSIVLKPLRRIRAKDLLGLAGSEKVSIEEVEASLAYTS